MILEDCEALNGLLEEFRQEEYEAEDQIQDITRHIKEAETYLKNLLGSESDDYKVFSPRKAEIIYKEEIDKIKGEIEESEEQRKKICGKRDILSKRIHTIEGILSHYDADCAGERKEAGDLQASSVDSLNTLIDKIKVSGTYIDRNPIRAKQDYVIISKCLREVVDRIQDTVWMYK